MQWGNDEVDAVEHHGGASGKAQQCTGQRQGGVSAVVGGGLAVGEGEDAEAEDGHDADGDGDGDADHGDLVEGVPVDAHRGFSQVAVPSAARGRGTSLTLFAVTGWRREIA